MEPRPPSARAQQAAVLLPLLGVVLLLPPFIALFVAPVAVAGVPLIVAYLFGAWGLLIGLALWLARRLAPRDAEPPPTGPR